MSERPMHCGDAAPYLSAYSDGELEDALRARVAAHVAGCAQCEAEVRRHAAISELVGTLPRSMPSPEVLDRVLAAVVRPAAPSPVTRESLLRRPKLLAPRNLPPLLRMHGDTPAVVRPIGRRGRPPSIAARVIPVMAAALLIAFSVLAFSRFSLGFRLGGRPPVSPAPRSLASVLAQTQRQVNAVRSTLPFTPVVPTYLPPGVSLLAVNTGAEPSDAALRYLDMSWALAYPLAATLHIRESALPLGQRGDFFPSANSDPTLTWSLGQHQWVPGLVQGAPERCAVGESRPGMSIAVEVALRGSGGACDTSNYAEINVLRLSSLALDAPYLPLSVLAPDSAHAVLHFTAYKTVPSGPSWDVYVDPIHQRTSITALAAGGSTLYTDLIAADGSVTRVDPHAKHYQQVPGSAAAGEPAQLTTQAATIFTIANTLLGSGELWNMGIVAAPTWLAGVGQVYKLELVGAPYPTAIFVDPATKQVLGAWVDYQSAEHPGGPRASSKLTPIGACPSYALIQYLPPSAVPANTFTPTAGYTQTAVTVTPVTC